MYQSTRNDNCGRRIDYYLFTFFAKSNLYLGTKITGIIRVKPHKHETLIIWVNMRIAPSMPVTQSLMYCPGKIKSQTFQILPSKTIDKVGISSGFTLRITHIHFLYKVSVFRISHLFSPPVIKKHSTI